MIAFAAKTAAKAPNSFQWGRNPQKLPLPLERSGPHLIHGSLGPPKSAATPNGILINSAVFAGLTNMTNTEIDRQIEREADRPTDHATLSVERSCYRCDAA